MINIPYSKEQLMRANMKLMEKNKRYREALQSILDYNHHELTIPLDVIEVIEKALEGEE